MNNWLKMIVLPLTLLIGIVIGVWCTKPVNATIKEPLKMIDPDLDDPYSYEMVDKDTHVHYLVVEDEDSKGISITPRLNKNGRPILK